MCFRHGWPDIDSMNVVLNCLAYSTNLLVSVAPIYKSISCHGFNSKNLIIARYSIRVISLSRKRKECRRNIQGTMEIHCHQNTVLTGENNCCAMSFQFKESSSEKCSLEAIQLSLPVVYRLQQDYWKEQTAPSWQPKWPCNMKQQLQTYSCMFK